VVVGTASTSAVESLLAAHVVPHLDEGDVAGFDSSADELATTWASAASGNVCQV
jgi:hypothetical protein